MVGESALPQHELQQEDKVLHHALAHLVEQHPLQENVQHPQEFLQCPRNLLLMRNTHPQFLLRRLLNDLFNSLSDNLDPFCYKEIVESLI